MYTPPLTLHFLAPAFNTLGGAGTRYLVDAPELAEAFPSGHAPEAPAGALPERAPREVRLDEKYLVDAPELAETFRP